MLKSLNIENIAVIEKADIEFSSGLNVLTGETGAGKSIVVDSINAILGERTSKDLVRHGAFLQQLNRAMKISTVMSKQCSMIWALHLKKTKALSFRVKYQTKASQTAALTVCRAQSVCSRS